MPEPQTTKPALMDMRTLAKLVGWKTQRVKRLLLRKEIGFKVGGRWYTTLAGIRAALPELYTVVEYEAQRSAFDLSGFE